MHEQKKKMEKTSRVKPWREKEEEGLNEVRINERRDRRVEIKRD